MKGDALQRTSFLWEMFAVACNKCFNGNTLEDSGEI